MEEERKKFHKKLVSYCSFSSHEECFPLLCLWTQMTLLIDPFPVNHCWLFPMAAPFSALFVLSILLDKCRMKSFENITGI